MAWLSGGVAIDQWLGRVTRDHGDIDVSVRRSDADKFLRGLSDRYELFAAYRGRLTPLYLPSKATNIWCSDRTSNEWVLQVNIEDGDDVDWIYRRHPSITESWDRAVIDVNGISCVAPQVQLLWKSKSPQPKDDADLAQVLPQLGAAAREWLAAAVAQAHPESPWASRLGAP